MYLFVLEAFERPIAKATDASHIVVRRPVSGCEFEGLRPTRRPLRIVRMVSKRGNLVGSGVHENMFEPSGGVGGYGDRERKRER